MGQIIDSDDCPICEEFKDGWIFTYGDLVTLLLCFFILLFSLCKIDDHKLKQSKIMLNEPNWRPKKLVSEQAILRSTKTSMTYYFSVLMRSNAARDSSISKFSSVKVSLPSPPVFVWIWPHLGLHSSRFDTWALIAGKYHDFVPLTTTRSCFR